MLDRIQPLNPIPHQEITSFKNIIVEYLFEFRTIHRMNEKLQLTENLYNFILFQNSHILHVRKSSNRLKFKRLLNVMKDKLIEFKTIRGTQYYHDKFDSYLELINRIIDSE